MMITNDAAIQYLFERENDDEDSRSIYWEYHVREFSIDLDGVIHGNSTLGSAPKTRSFLRRFMHRLMQAPVRKLGRHFKHATTCEKMGRAIASRQDRLFNGDFLRHSLTLAMILEHVDIKNSSNTNLVIGDGFGTMTSLLLEAAPERKVLHCNLTKPLCLDLFYTRNAFPDVSIAVVRNKEELMEALSDDTVRVIGVQADNAPLLANAPIGLAVNIVSMQEMDLAIVSRYFDILRSNPATETAFYCCNRRFKISNFEEYPWHDEDKIIETGVCAWSQLYYDLRPPFWHQRDNDKKVIWHRLAFLGKTASSATVNNLAQSNT
jgi:putative sugar O-methyltransferase